MYNFGEERSLSGLLELIRGAAVAVTEGVVEEYNSAAGRLLPRLREGERLKSPEPGYIELCGVRFEAVSYDVGESEIYAFAVPAEAAAADALPVLENMSRSIKESLSPSFAASELIAAAAEEMRLEKLQRYNAVLRHEQYRLLNIAENLHEYCLLAGESDVLAPTMLDLDELCGDVANTVRALVAGHGINITLSVGSGDFSAYADKRRIERMLLALLANSAEACRGGGDIRLELWRDGSCIRLLIADNGKGLDPGADVFDMFARPADPEDGPNGMGMSLAVARMTALRHGGNLMIGNDPAGGTRVVVTLPVNRPEGATVSSGRVIYAANPMRDALSAFANLLDHKSYGPPYL